MDYPKDGTFVTHVDVPTREHPFLTCQSLLSMNSFTSSQVEQGLSKTLFPFALSSNFMALWSGLFYFKLQSYDFFKYHACSD